MITPRSAQAAAGADADGDAGPDGAPDTLQIIGAVLPACRREPAHRRSPAQHGAATERQWRMGAPTPAATRLAKALWLARRRAKANLPPVRLPSKNRERAGRPLHPMGKTDAPPSGADEHGKPKAMARAKTALVLSGGGSLGAVQVGMLLALSTAQLSIDMVVGASVGALNGAFFADDPTPAGVERLAGLWRSLRRKDVFPLSLLAGLKALVFRRDHLVESRALHRIVQRVLHMQRIEQARIPLHVMATDVLSGADVQLSSGDIAAALMASTAIPVVFPSVEIDGNHLVDGAVANNTPIANAVALGAERILVLPTGTSCAMQDPPRNMAALALHVLGLQHMRRLDRDVERFSAQASITIVPPLCPLGVSVFDFSQTASLISRAAKQTHAWLADGGLSRVGSLHVPLAHRHPPRAMAGSHAQFITGGHHAA